MYGPRTSDAEYIWVLCDWLLSNPGDVSLLTAHAVFIKNHPENFFFSRDK